MGDLIVMSRTKPLPPRERIASAEILFFTGVRYYRSGDDAGAKPAMPRVGAKAAGKSPRAGGARHRPDVAPIEAMV